MTDHPDPPPPPPPQSPPDPSAWRYPGAGVPLFTDDTGIHFKSEGDYMGGSVLTYETEKTKEAWRKRLEEIETEQRQRERKEYERLKAEFGGETT